MEDLSKLLLGLKSEIYSKYMTILNNEYASGIVEVKPRKGEMIIKNNNTAFHLTLPVYAYTLDEIDRLQSIKDKLFIRYDLLKNKLIYGDPTLLVQDEFDNVAKQMKSLDEEITKLKLYHKLANHEFDKEQLRLAALRENVLEKMKDPNITSKFKVQGLDDVHEYNQGIMNQRDRYIDYYIVKLPQVEEVKKMRKKAEVDKKGKDGEGEAEGDGVDEDIVKEMVKAKLKRAPRKKKEEKN